MKRVLITGANGFIGRSLTEQLLHNGYEVYAVVKNKNDLIDISSDNLKVVVCEFSDYDSIANKIKKS